MKDTENAATDAPLMSEAALARLEQMRRVPFETVADEASMLVMTGTMALCVKALEISQSEDETRHTLGAAFQLLFMLGRASGIACCDSEPPINEFRTN